MKVIRYTGPSTVRVFSGADLERAFGVSVQDGIRIDTRVSRDVTVKNVLADKLVESGEFALSDVSETEDEDEPQPDEPEALAGTEDSDSVVARAQHVPGPETVSDGPSKSTKVRRPAS